MEASSAPRTPFLLIALLFVTLSLTLRDARGTDRGDGGAFHGGSFPLGAADPFVQARPGEGLKEYALIDDDDLDAKTLVDAIEGAMERLKKRPASEKLRFGSSEIGVEKYISETLEPAAALARKGTKPLLEGVQTSFKTFRHSPPGEGEFSAYHQGNVGDRPKTAPDLIPGRSVAVDPEIYPKDVLVWIRTDKPGIVGKNVIGWFSFGRFAITVDSRLEVKGPNQLQVYLGTGEYAEAASAQKARKGELYVLLGR